MTNKKTTVGILGGGISGLSTAYALAKKGIPATVYEKEDQVGGAISTKKKDGWLIEEGPNTLMVNSQAIWDLLEELELGDYLIEASKKSKKRYVVKNSIPTALPMSLGSFLTTSLLSLGDKFRLFKEPFIAPSIQQDESVASFIQRRLGKQPLDYGVNPFVSGIYAGDPKELSVKHTFSSLWQMEQNHGSLLKGIFKRDRTNSVRRSLISFEKGNQTLPKRLANSLPVPAQTSTTVTSVSQNNEQWQVKGRSKESSFEQIHDCIVSTLPTYSLNDIFESKLFDELASLPYVPLSVFALGFQNQQIQHPLDGFGMLIPEVENYRTLGVLFSSTLFPGRAPKDHHLLTCFIGGARYPELASKSKKELQSIVLSELEELLGVTGQPDFIHHKFWQQAIPQYNIGFDHYLSLMKEIEKTHTGLYLDGNFRNGVSVPDCISSGFETAQKVHSFLQRL